MADDERLENQQEPQAEAEQEAALELSEEEAALERLQEQVQVAIEEVGTLRKKLTIAIPRESIDERIEKQYGELSREAVVPGFRKGRAPRRLLEKRFGTEVSETITTDLLGAGYLAATRKTKLKTIGDPLIWCRPKRKGDATPEEGERLMTVREAFEHIELPHEGPFVFACEVEVRPEFELPNLKGIPVERPKVVITNEDVERQIDRFLLMRATIEPVADGEAVRKDDLLALRVKMTVDGKLIKEQDGVSVAARAQVIEGIPFENFGQLMEGARIGDIRKITGVIPEDDERAELRGKTAEFEMEVRQILRRRKPELTRELVETLGFSGLEEFRDYIRSDMEARSAEAVRRGMRSQVYRYLLENTKLDLPERLSQRQAARIVIRRMLEMYRQGVPEAEVTRHLDELKTTSQAEAARDLKIALIMEKIAEELKPEVTEDEVNGQIAAIAYQQNRRFDRVRDELIRNDALDALYVQIRDEKIVDALLEDAAIRETEPPGVARTEPKEEGPANADAT